MSRHIRPPCSFWCSPCLPPAWTYGIFLGNKNQSVTASLRKPHIIHILVGNKTNKLWNLLLHLPRWGPHSLITGSSVFFSKLESWLVTRANNMRGSTFCWVIFLLSVPLPLPSTPEYAENKRLNSCIFKRIPLLGCLDEVLLESVTGIHTVCWGWPLF